MRTIAIIGAGLLALSVSLAVLPTAALAAPAQQSPSITQPPAVGQTPSASPTPTAEPTSTDDMMTPGPINDKWLDEGGADGEDGLGRPLQWQFCPLVRGGCFQMFERGNIYHLNGNGTYAVRQPQLDRWGVWGWEAGELGYPTSDEFLYLGGADRTWQEFENGNILRNGGSGAAHVLRGAIGDSWFRGGNKQYPGRYGFPAADEVCGLRDAGCFQDFTNGPGRTAGSIYFSPATGAHGVHDAFYARWAEQRWETGSLGYPTTDKFCQLRDSGCGQHFQGGSIYSGSGAGPHIVAGWIREEYARDGWEAGSLGYPTSEARVQGQGAGRYWIQDFQHGWISVRWDGTDPYVGHHD